MVACGIEEAWCPSSLGTTDGLCDHLVDVNDTQAGFAPTCTDVISAHDYLFYHVTLERSEDRSFFSSPICVLYTKYSINIYCLTKYEWDNTNI